MSSADLYVLAAVVGYTFGHWIAATVLLVLMIAGVIYEEMNS